MSTIALNRPITSYSKVQQLIGNVIRNRPFQLRRTRLRDRALLDVGCGPNSHDRFVNMDFLWHPGIDVCWDVTRGLPFDRARFQGIFSEHCLEHFPLPTAARLLQEMRRVLVEGGVLRIVVPDAELYLRTYVSRLDGHAEARFPYEPAEGNRQWTPISHVNRVFYQDRESLYGHCTMFDLPLLTKVLTEAGFRDIVRRQFGESTDPRLCVESADRRVESLYVDAIA